MLRTKLYELADFLVMTIPEDRVGAYRHSGFSAIQFAVTGHANRLMEDLGFFPLRMQLDVLGYMEASARTIMTLGLVFDVLIILFVELSVMLMHSLLTLSVQHKVFDLGVMRMVGLSTTNLVSLIAIQALLFVTPSNILGLVTSVPCLAIVTGLLLGSDPDMSLSPFPNQGALIQTFTIGLLIPILSSIGPIQ